MKISASIYSNNGNDLEALIRELDAYKVSMFHIDCEDNPAVFEDIRKIRQISNTPVDLHLITSTPEKYFGLIIRNQVDYVTLQYEPLKSRLVLPSGFPSNTGLAIVSDTPVEVFEPYRENLGHILFMTTTPGKSGGTFNKYNFRKIREFRSKYEDKRIFVDGGINEEISFILRNMGVYASVIGSYLFRSGYIGSAMINLKSDNIESHFQVKDFMLEGDEIPVLTRGNFDFYALLKAIDDYKMGFCIITEPNGKLSGIVSNADVRKSLIRHIRNLNDIPLMDMINTNPAFVFEDDTVSDVLSYIKSLKFPILYLPVVDKNMQVKGTLKFNNLIKGES